MSRGIGWLVAALVAAGIVAFVAIAREDERPLRGAHGAPAPPEGRPAAGKPPREKTAPAAGKPPRERTAPAASRLTRRQAVALARAANLRAADVPYFERDPEDGEESEDDRRRGREFSRCVGDVEQGGDVIAARQSATYGTESGAFIRVQSQVSVLDSAELARQVSAAFRSRRGVACFRRVYTPALEGADAVDVEIGRVAITRLPQPVEGADGFGYRIAAPVTALGGDSSEMAAYSPGRQPVAGVTVMMYIDMLGVVAGPVQVILITVGAPQPVSKSLERNLLVTMRERANARLP